MTKRWPWPLNRGTGRQPCGFEAAWRQLFDKLVEFLHCLATVDLCKTQVTPRNVSKIPQTGTFHPQNPLNDSQIDKVHSLSFFCVVSSDFAGQRQRKNTGRATSTTVWAESLQNFAKFLPLPNFAHLPASGMLKFDKRNKSQAKNQCNCPPQPPQKPARFPTFAHHVVDVDH